MAGFPGPLTLRKCAAFAVPVALLGTLIACGSSGADAQTRETFPEASTVIPRDTRNRTMAPASPAAPETIAATGLADFNVNAGKLIQGGWIRGQAPAGTVSAMLGEEPVTLDRNGYFFAAFDRDAPATMTLTARLTNGRIVTKALTIAPRQWNIERINIARRAGQASEAFMARRRPELAQIHAARIANSQSDGWRQDFIWPVKGRISGRFGSQRIYAGVPGSYHSGLDIATGGSGTAYVAPADGVVVLAAKQPFSLEGYLLIIDHGNGLNSAFLHSSKLAVSVGDVVRQGQYIGNIGATGRATGPHLHWSIKWQGSRVDPLLFLGPMG